MKYECLEEKCRKVFLSRATVSYTKSDQGVIVVETYLVCPYCLSKNVDTIKVPALRIESIVSVKTAEADELIKKGYVVKDSYASSVTLVKYGVVEEKPPEKKQSLQESQEAIEKSSAELRKDLEGFHGP